MLQLKAEIVRLRAECERLTAAVDLYADNQNNLPLGETSEEFYRNIYTGQPLQSEYPIVEGNNDVSSVENKTDLVNDLIRV